MTDAQKRRVNQIRREAETFFKGSYEIKEFEVNENEFFVSVYVSIGVIGENIYHKLILRINAHIFIGPRGGMTIPVSRKLKNGEYKHYYKPYTSLIAADREQNKL